MITVFTPPPVMRRQMIRTTMRAMETVPEGSPTRLFLGLLVDFLRRDCPHEHVTVVVLLTALCQDCFTGIPIRIEDLPAPMRSPLLGADEAPVDQVHFSEASRSAG